jgi:hypothetical protein
MDWSDYIENDHCRADSLMSQKALFEITKKFN